MHQRVQRYLLGALSGCAVVGASVGGLQLLHSTRDSSTEASLRGSLPVSCTVRSAITSCRPQTVLKPDREEAASVYRDGSFDAVGHYLTPGGDESIGVAVTVTDGVVASAQVEVVALSPTARQFQNQFASRFADRVVGKNLADVAVSRIAGASLTSLGFDAALEQIRSDARV